MKVEVVYALRDGARCVTSITEVQRMESDVITLQEVYDFDGGRLQPTGLRPMLLHKFERHGLELPYTLFESVASA
jgi:pilus assembly protein CpaF